jgi:hypothetical protein
MTARYLKRSSRHYLSFSKSSASRLQTLFGRRCLSLVKVNTLTVPNQHTNPVADVGPLTMAEAKKGLAGTFGVSPEASKSSFADGVFDARFSSFSKRAAAFLGSE